MRFMLKAGEIEWWRALYLAHVQQGCSDWDAANKADNAINLFRARWNPGAIPAPIIPHGPYR